MGKESQLTFIYFMKMRFLFCIALLFLFQFVKAQQFQWTNGEGGTNNDQGNKVTTDKFGNIYVCGNYRTTITFGNTVLTSVANTQDIFIAKYDPSGKCLWVKSAGGTTGYDEARTIFVDDSGYVYVGGKLGTKATFGKDSIVRSNSSGELFVFKCDNVFGSLIWAKTITIYDALAHNLMDIVVGKSGSVYVTGNFDSRMRFGNMVFTGSSYGTNSTIQDLFIAKFNYSGSFLWVQRTSAGVGSYTIGTGITADNDENLYLTGFFSKSISFPCLTIQAEGGYDIFVSKYDSSGTCKWVKRAGGVANDESTDIIGDKKGNLYLSGGFSNIAKFDTNTVVSSGNYDSFSANYDTSGTCKWTAKGGGTGFDYGFGINLDHKGNILLTGTFAATYKLINSILISKGSGDIFIASLDSTGNLNWLRQMGGTGNDYGNAITSDDNDNLYTTGYYSGICIFNEDTLQSKGLNDFFLTKIRDNHKFNIIHGNIFIDKNKNCNYEPTDEPLESFIIQVLPGPQYANSDRDGSYIIKVDTGTYSITDLIPHRKRKVLTKSCKFQDAVLNFENYGNDTSIYFSNQSINSSYLTVDVQSTRRTRCFKGHTFISYCNEGYESVNSVEVRIIYPPYTVPISSSPMWKFKQDSLIIFEFESLPADSCGFISITDSVLCINNIAGLSQCVEVTIKPKNLSSTSALWDGSDVYVKGTCISGKSKFEIINQGNRSMLDSSWYRVYSNDTLIYYSQFKLETNESILIPVASAGNTIRLEADQNPGYPTPSRPRATVENCPVNSNLSIRGLVNSVPQDDEDDQTDISCLPIIQSFDPNDKQAIPIGVASNHYIKISDRLEYTVRFENTGTDTAYTVRIIDSLDENLDINTFVPMISSHPYRLELTGKGIPVLKFTFDDIKLPDTSISKANSNGFISYSICPNNSIPLGGLIKNKAEIYFDYNDPIVTNIVTHQIWDTTTTDLTKGVFVENGVVTFIGGKSYTGTVNIYPNPAINEFFVSIVNIDMPCNYGLFSILGEPIQSGEIDNASLSLPIQGLSTGIYFFKIYSGDEVIYTGKIIKE